MKALLDAERLLRVAKPQKGVFSRTDLWVLFEERHPAAFKRRVQALIEAGVLRRFSRGFYVREEFDLPTLSQRLAPDSYLSLGTALAHHLLVGTQSTQQVTAARPGRSGSYRNLGFEVLHVHVAPHLDFGHIAEGGVRWADAEKAALDTLYFHLRGRRFFFDIFSDIDYARLDRNRLQQYLGRFQNPKFVVFARGVLGLK